MVYAKQPLVCPTQGLEYLSRYTHRVAISNERILNVSDDSVRFKVRDNDGQGKKVKLPAVEFIHRFMQHILPSNFKRIRHYGILGNAHKANKLAQARNALIEAFADFIKRVTHAEWLDCPHCGIGQFVLLDVLAPIPRATGGDMNKHHVHYTAMPWYTCRATPNACRNPQKRPFPPPQLPVR